MALYNSISEMTGNTPVLRASRFAAGFIPDVPDTDIYGEVIKVTEA